MPKRLKCTIMVYSIKHKPICEYAHCVKNISKETYTRSRYTIEILILILLGHASFV